MRETLYVDAEGRLRILSPGGLLNLLKVVGFNVNTNRWVCMLIKTADPTN